jgi:hypothetical protein
MIWEASGRFSKFLSLSIETFACYASALNHSMKETLTVLENKSWINGTVIDLNEYLKVIGNV